MEGKGWGQKRARRKLLPCNAYFHPFMHLYHIATYTKGPGFGYAVGPAALASAEMAAIEMESLLKEDAVPSVNKSHRI